jgi:hypothetical protein
MAESNTGGLLKLDSKRRRFEISTALLIAILAAIAAHIH